jgi:palmitoyltransferase
LWLFLITWTGTFFIRFVAVFVAGTVRDPASPASFGDWLGYSVVYHTGAVAFFMMDLFIFFGVACLAVVQASQVFKV